MSQMRFRIGLVKPVSRMIVGRTIKATDKAWREAIFGLGGSRKRIAGLKFGNVEGQPLAVITELQENIAPGTPVWTIETPRGLFAFAGPGAIYNDMGFGPGSLGVGIDRLKELIQFDPDPVALQEALQRTLEWKPEANASDTAVRIQ